MKIPTNRYIGLYLRIWSEPVIVLFELCCSREHRGISSLEIEHEFPSLCALRDIKMVALSPVN